ncbi:MAG: hypothetical protein V3W08_08875 [Candidatus Binatia bacterium]
MKHLKSSLSDLRRIFEENFTVRYLAPPFVSFDDSRAADKVRTFMEPPRDYDVVGVRKDGLIEGYVNREDLGPGVLNDYLKPFEPSLLLDESANIRDALRLLCEPPHRVYVQVSGVRHDICHSPEKKSQSWGLIIAILQGKRVRSL